MSVWAPISTTPTTVKIDACSDDLQPIPKLRVYCHFPDNLDYLEALFLYQVNKQFVLVLLRGDLSFQKTLTLRMGPLEPVTEELKTARAGLI